MRRAAGGVPRLVLAAMVALSAAACGNTTTTTGSPTTRAAATPTAGVTSAGAPTTSATETAAVTASSTAGTAIDCTPPAEPTIEQTEGPYFTPDAPLKPNLVEEGMAGTRLTFTGFVIDTSCQPLAGTKLDVWQADAAGAYDNEGYRLRGHVITDAAGAFTVETIVPAEYPGRTPHIHVKVTPPGGATLTSQVYFPDATANDRDRIFRDELLLDVTPSGDGFVGRFTFVIGSR
jgi:protocatechuate 3,4-dioxygenase beta subunit